MKRVRVCLGAFQVLVCVMCWSCSSTQSGGSQPFAGQWSGTLTPNNAPPTSGFAADIVSVGSILEVSAGLMITGLRCDTPMESANGQLNGNDIMLTAMLENATYSFTGTMSADGSSMSGAYTQTENNGSACPGGDHGTWSLQKVANASGSYAGPADTSDPINATQAMMTATITESGGFGVNISVNVTNSMCFAGGSFSGTIVGAGFMATSSDQSVTISGGEPDNTGTTPPADVVVNYSLNEPNQPCDGASGSGVLKRTGT